MPLTEESVRAQVEALNRGRRGDAAARLVAFEGERFKVSFSDRPVGDATCADEDFSMLQFLLKGATSTMPVSSPVAHDEDAGRFVVSYERVAWD